MSTENAFKEVLDPNSLKAEDTTNVNKEKDYYEQVKSVVAETVENLENNKETLTSTIDNLLSWEKKTRLACDIESTQLLATTIIDCCFKKNDWETLNKMVSTICKRRVQQIKVIKGTIDKAMSFLDKTPNIEIKKELINTLRSASESKLYAELEYAELTKMLSNILEEEGDIVKASEILQEVTAETVGSMTTYDRAAYLLEQLRLCLKNKDYVRAELVSKKITAKQFSNPSWFDIRLNFYTLMLQLYAHENNYLEQAKLWKNIFTIYADRAYKELIELNIKTNDASNNTTTTSMVDDKHTDKDIKNNLEIEDTVFPTNENTTLWQNALLKTVLFCILSIYNEEIQQIANELSQKKKMLSALPLAKSLLDILLAKDLVEWPLVDQDNHPIEDLVKSDTIFSSSLSDENNTYKDRWNDLHTRIVEKNIRTISSHYSQITLLRLSELVGISLDKTEECLCEMITRKQLRAKIDRPKGTVQFRFHRTSVEVLTEWTVGISKLFDLVENTANLIHKENMAHNIRSRVA